MDRKALLLKLVDQLGEALYLMETTEAKPDDGDEVWFATGSEIAAHYREHCWDATVADITRRGLATGGTGFADAPL